MSVAHRSIARLPLEIFENLSTCSFKGEPPSPEELRAMIVKQLKSAQTKKRFRTIYVHISTVGPFLRLSPLALLRALDPLLTYAECLELRQRIARFCAPVPTTAYDLLQASYDVLQLSSWPQALLHAARMRYLPTGLAPLDVSLLGGLRVGTLTELAGAAGSGKTQMAMQTIVMAAAYRQGAIYVDTERKLSLPRLQEIATERHKEGQLLQQQHIGADSRYEVYSASLGHGSARQYVSPTAVLENLTVHTPASMEELNTVLGTLEEEIALRNQDSSSEQSRFPVRLLILDSIAAPARRDFSAGSAPQRAAAVMHCAQTLKRLADQFHLAVLIINQVGSSGSWNQGTTLAATEAPNGGAPSRAALGTAWHHCVTTRIQLEFSGATNGVANASGLPGPIRGASVVKSNTVGQGKLMSFTINNTGLVGC